MDKRLAKQVIYGSGFILFFALIILGTYLIWFKPAPPEPSPIPANLAPIEANWTKHFSATASSREASKTVIVAEIKNPNLDWALQRFVYTFTLYGKNNEMLQAIENSSAIYAGQIKYIVETASVAADDISNIKVDFASLNWKLKTDFPLPKTQIRNIQTQFETNDAGPIVTGYIKNNEAFALTSITVVGFLFNADGTQLTASKNQIGGLNPYEERLFTINFPKNIFVANPSSSLPVYLFTKNSSLGATGADALRLNQFLKDQSFLSNEATEEFTSATQNALIKYQKAVKIEPANGLLGPKTRGAINAELTNQAVAAGMEHNSSGADPGKTEVYVEVIK